MEPEPPASTAEEGGRTSSGERTAGAYQPALEGKGYGKSEMSYSDFTRLPSGLLFKNAKVNFGASNEISNITYYYKLRFFSPSS